jgi:hypothetical protein
MSYGGFSHGPALDRTERALRERRPFRRSGYHMWAIEGHYDPAVWPVLGRLPAEHAEQFRADAERGIAYTVFSYQTPIAWVTSSGLVRIPDVKYSPTTTQHQWACQLYLADGG